MNSLKWAFVFLLIGLGVVGHYHFSNHALFLRVLGLVLLFGLAIVVALQTESGKRFWQFFQAAKAELHKVVWPNRKETVQTTVMVLAVVGIVGVILWGVDSMLLKVVAFLTGYGVR